MKTYNEMADEVFRIGDERIKESKVKKRKTAAVLSVTVAVLLSVTVWQSVLLSRKPLSVSSEKIKETTSEKVSDVVEENHADSTQPTASASEITTGNTPKVVAAPKAGGQAIATPKSEASAEDGDVYGGETSGGFFIPAFPTKVGIEYAGERLTDEDAKNYFKQNKASIISSLSASGVETENAVIKEKGYCHASYNGEEGKPLTVKQDFRDYLVYNGEKIIAIITLYKQDGKIYSSPAFGAPWFENYAKYLNQHKGEELVYVYAGQMEIIVAPDGSICNPIGSDCSEYVGGVKNLYERLYCPEIVYVP